MYLRLTGIALLLGTLVFSSGIHAETQSILGPGATTCGRWTDDRKSDKYPDQLGWALGFVSSYNHYMNANIFGNLDALAIAGWIDIYCAANPLDTVYAASVELIKKLDKRASSQ